MIDSSITLFTGPEPVLSAYVGTTLVYPSAPPPVPPTPVGPYDEMYFTTRALEDDTTISFKLIGSITTSDATSISYSMDNGLTWNTTIVDGAQHTISVSGLSSGDTVIWKGTAVRWSEIGHEHHCNFQSNGFYDVYGNIMSLLYGDDFESATTVNSYSFCGLFYPGVGFKRALLSAENLVLPATELEEGCYDGLFEQCSVLEDAPLLPATTLADNCYRRMFNGCRSLTTAPALPASTMEEGCYSLMFNNCISLVTPPVLSATTLAESCYENMFQSCLSLTTSPALPAETLADRCYFSMFSGCTGLTGITCLATDISANQCTYHWVYNVSSSGTFTKATGVSWPTGGSGIPSGWTVVEV